MLKERERGGIKTQKFLCTFLYVCVCMCMKTVCCLPLIWFVLVLYSYLHPLPPTQTYAHTCTHSDTHTLTTYWLHLKYTLCYLTLQRKPPKQKHCLETVPIYMNYTVCVLCCMKAQTHTSNFHAYIKALLLFFKKSLLLSLHSLCSIPFFIHFNASLA